MTKITLPIKLRFIIELTVFLTSVGESFAMMSGTSMAAPHIAGLAALIKQKFPSFSPSAIGSALSTTASLNDKKGGPIMAQRAYTNPDVNQSPATPFDMGSGFVNATGALDPGLILDSGTSPSFALRPLNY